MLLKPDQISKEICAGKRLSLDRRLRQRHANIEKFFCQEMRLDKFIQGTAIGALILGAFFLITHAQG